MKTIDFGEVALQFVRHERYPPPGREKTVHSDYGEITLRHAADGGSLTVLFASLKRTAMVNMTTKEVVVKGPGGERVVARPPDPPPSGMKPTRVVKTASLADLREQEEAQAAKLRPTAKPKPKPKNKTGQVSSDPVWADQLDEHGNVERVDTNIYCHPVACCEEGCNEIRYVKKSDVFQVRRCKPHARRFKRRNHAKNRAAHLREERKAPEPGGEA